MSQIASNPAGNRRPGNSRRNGLLILLLIILLLILLLLFFFPRPAATIVLTPVSKSLSNQYNLPVPLQTLSSVQHNSQTGEATGPIKPGTYAHGSLLFKNYTSFPVTIAKGTVISNNASQQVATDETIVIPPDPPIIPGIASVSATAVKVGKSGNIKAMSINRSCCFPGISVLNSSNFGGGLDDQTTHTIQQGDIDKIAKTLEIPLIQQGQHSVQVQLKRGERLLNTPAQCPNPLVISDPSVGVSAERFTVTVTVTCADMAYNPETALAQAQNKLEEMATQQFGSDFALSGDITTTIEQISPPQNGNIDILVMANGLWKYQFTASRDQALARQIANLTGSAARTLLLRQTGVAGVASISITGPILDFRGHNILPDDPAAITIIA